MQIIWIFFAKPEEIQRAKQSVKALPLPEQDSDRFEFPNSSSNESLTEFFCMVSELRPEWNSLHATFTYVGNGDKANLGDSSGMDHQFFVADTIVKAAHTMFEDPEFTTLKAKVISEIANRPGYKGTNSVLLEDGKYSTRPVTSTDVEAALNIDIKRIQKIYSRAAAENLAVVIDVCY